MVKLHIAKRTRRVDVNGMKSPCEVDF